MSEHGDHMRSGARVLLLVAAVLFVLGAFLPPEIHVVAVACSVFLTWWALRVSGALDPPAVMWHGLHNSDHEMGLAVPAPLDGDSWTYTCSCGWSKTY